MSRAGERTGPAGLPYRPCAGVVLVNDRGEVFAGHRIDNAADAWQMPQGGIDKGEDIADAALRELWEETGVTADKVAIEAVAEDWLYYDLPPELVGRMWKGKYGGQRQKWVLIYRRGPGREHRDRSSRIRRMALDAPRGAGRKDRPVQARGLPPAFRRLCRPSERRGTEGVRVGGAGGDADQGAARPVARALASDGDISHRRCGRAEGQGAAVRP